jgi:predicted HicB family RNase H-like nuclease
MAVSEAAIDSPDKRVTAYLKSEFHRALKIKAAETESSVSDLVNSAVRQALLEDAADLEAFEKGAGEPLVRFEDVVTKLKRDGKV